MRVPHFRIPTRLSLTPMPPPDRGAQYFSLSNGGETIDDIAWSYATPLPEAALIAEHVCFYKRHANGIYVDGVRQEGPPPS